MDAPALPRQDDPTAKSIKSTILTFAILATLIPSLGLGGLSFWRYQVIIGDSAAHAPRALAGDATARPDPSGRPVASSAAA